MDTKTRNILIIGSIITFIVVPIAATLILAQVNKQPAEPAIVTNPEQLPERSNDDLQKAITEQSSELGGENAIAFTITNVKQPEKGWYVVTVRTDDDPEGLNPAKLLLQDTGDRISLLLGPGTSFSPETTQQVGVPDAVAQELNR